MGRVVAGGSFVIGIGGLAPLYSQGKAVVGSTLTARRAGNKHAAGAVAASNDAVRRNVGGSVAQTPIDILST